MDETAFGLIISKLLSLSCL